MRVWREDELSDGWFPEGIDIVPSVSKPLLAVATLVLSIVGALIHAATARLGHRY
ncbi:MAG: hypothetical protein ABWY52_00320 [Candidatus Limnocylindrales bacterium]